MTLSSPPVQKRRWAWAAIALIAAAILSGAIFAAWVNNGPQILLTLGSNALAWCF